MLYQEFLLGSLQLFFSGTCWNSSFLYAVRISFPDDSKSWTVFLWLDKIKKIEKYSIFGVFLLLFLLELLLSLFHKFFQNFHVGFLKMFFLGFYKNVWDPSKHFFWDQRWKMSWNFTKKNHEILQFWILSVRISDHEHHQCIMWIGNEE